MVLDVNLNAIYPNVMGLNILRWNPLTVNEFGEDKHEFDEKSM